MNLATIELENGRGTRTAVQFNVNKKTRKIKVGVSFIGKVLNGSIFINSHE